MAKEDKMCSMKDIQNTSEDLNTLRAQCNNRNLHEINSSKPCFRKSTTNLFIPCLKELPLSNEETLIKKSSSFSGTPCESESQKQPWQECRKNKTSNHRSEPKLDMKTVCNRMTEYERCLLKRAQTAEGKKRQSIPLTSNTSKDESRQMNIPVDLTLLRNNLESQNLIGINHPISNLLLMNSSANSVLSKHKSMIPQRRIKNNATPNREHTSTISTNSKQLKSKLRVLRKTVSKNSSSFDQASKITSDAASPKIRSKTKEKIPSSVELSPRTSTDSALTMNKSRAVRKIPSRNITSADPAPKTALELAKSRVPLTKPRIDKESEKLLENQSSINRTSQPPERKSAYEQTDEPKKRNLSKTLSTSIAKSKSIDVSPRSRSKVSIQIQESINHESPAQVQGNDLSTEPVNTPQLDQKIDSNTISNSKEPIAPNTSETTSSSIALTNEHQASLQQNDRIERTSSVISNSASERILNFDCKIQQYSPENRSQPILSSPQNRSQPIQSSPENRSQPIQSSPENRSQPIQPSPENRSQRQPIQSSPESRSQPIPIDPNAAYATKHDLETWLRNTAAQRSDTPRPLKKSLTHPFPIFPVIRPCDKDITSDPEDCKKKLGQKLEQMHKLKQAYYANPNDNIPFINLAYTKEGIFVDEPIEHAFVYDDEFLKIDNSENHSQLSSEARRNQSESAVFSSARLNLKDDQASTSSFTSDKVVDNKTSYSKWINKILDENEIDMMENVLDEFQYKFNKLAFNIQQVSLNSETSSNSEPVPGSKPRIIIPERSSHSDK